MGEKLMEIKKLVNQLKIRIRQDLDLFVDVGSSKGEIILMIKIDLKNAIIA